MIKDITITEEQKIQKKVYDEWIEENPFEEKITKETEEILGDYNYYIYNMEIEK